MSTVTRFMGGDPAACLATGSVCAVPVSRPEQGRDVGICGLAVSLGPGALFRQGQVCDDRSSVAQDPEPHVRLGATR